MARATAPTPRRVRSVRRAIRSRCGLARAPWGPGMIRALMKQLRAAWEFVLALVTRFREERATQTAGSLTYTSLLSLVPLLTVALGISSAFPVFEDWTGSLQLFILE